MNLQRTLDPTIRPLPLSLDDACARIGKLLKSGLEEVQTVRRTLWTLVDDHGGDAVDIWSSDAHAGTAVGARVPVLAAEGSAIDAGGESVGAEAAHAAIDIAAVEGRSAGELARGTGGQSREHGEGKSVHRKSVFGSAWTLVKEANCCNRMLDQRVLKVGNRGKV